MICPSCGAQVPDNEYMCPNCSSSLSSVRDAQYYDYSPRPKKKKRSGISPWTVIIVLVFVFGIASVGLYFLTGDKPAPSPAEQSSDTHTPPNMAANPEEHTVTVTFREGLRLLEVAELLEENGVCNAAEFVEATQTMDIAEYSFAKEVEANANERYYRLEGYLFPDTYEFYRNEDPEQAAVRMLTNYERRITAELRDRAAELNMSMDNVVALASIITKEAGKTDEMPLVSSVFHNRLKDSYGKLESDPTYYYPYASRNDIPKEEKETFQSRYNTYKIQGLPPGAICNPGMDAIQAALSPADTDYYFFVYDVFGKYYFATTWEEHKRNVALIQEIKSGEQNSDNASKE